MTEARTLSPSARRYLPIKRAIDILVSGTALLLTLPFFMLALLLNIIDGHRKPFFTQTRLGRGRKEFTIYKFRTMKSTATIGPDGKPIHYQPDAAELTKIGRFLRNTNMDELPQLLNVLCGDMSLIGPRPHALEYAEFYASIDARYYERYLVVPGIAGPVQVSPLRHLGEAPEHVRARIDADLDYIARLSFRLDAEIFFKACMLVVHSVLKVRTPQAYRL